MFSQPRTVTFADTRAIAPGESSEPLVDVRGRSKHIVCEYETSDMTQYVGEAMLLREDVARRLVVAAELLSERMPGAQLKLVYAYRHPDVQALYFERESAKIRARYPGLSEDEIAERTHCLIAVPEVAGHPTGGAVDLTIIGPGGPLDMGTGVIDFSDEDLIRFFSTRVTDEQRENRAALRRVMTDERVGFAPFDGEWWHFSYGDREWAAYYELPKAIYGPISADITAELLRTSTLPR